MIESYRATLEGEYVCLPQKDASQLHTPECIYGLKTDAGEYYGIDFSAMSQTVASVQVGQKISATGSVHPVEMFNDSLWERYPIEGMFWVTDSLTVIE